jgi:hypothetical protein
VFATGAIRSAEKEKYSAQEELRAMSLLLHCRDTH